MGEGELPIGDYTGRPHPKEAPFSSWSYITGKEFHMLKNRKGWERLSLRYLKYTKYTYKKNMSIPNILNRRVKTADSFRYFKGKLKLDVGASK